MVHSFLVTGTDEQLKMFHVATYMFLNLIDRREQSVRYTCFAEHRDFALSAARASGVIIAEWTDAGWRAIPEPVQMRSQDEIQRAHDMLVGILLGELPLELEEPALTPIRIAADVLCWVLQHDHNKAFTEILTATEQAAARAGYALNRDDSTR